MRSEQERWWDSPTFTGQTDDWGNPLFSDEGAPEYLSAGSPEQQESATPCERGGHHRWDFSRARCLDCGREAVEIADELYDWLAETEDQVDQLSDQIEALRTLLEEAADLLDGAGDPQTRERIRAKLAELEEEQ
jgi:hypothetical protein